MHADPADRFEAPTAPDFSRPPLSVARIFVVGLVLPFLHPIRLILGSVLPALIMIGLFFGPLRPVIGSLRSLAEAPAPSFGGDVATLLGAGFGEGIIMLELGTFLALAVWLCAWQRNTARGFAEPILRWLAGSVLRLPGYILALLVWTLTPALVFGAAEFGVISVIKRALSNEGLTPATTRPLDYLTALTSTQWWTVGIAMLVAALIALWLAARLCPLPALVASQGWRGAFGRGWRLSRGHGFGLSVSLLAYVIVASILSGIAFAIIASATFYAYRDGPSTYGAEIASVGVIFDVGVLALAMIWQSSLGALVVRNALAAEIDPAMFD